jgi:hypothetical protein
MGCPPIALAGYNDFAGSNAGHADRSEPATQWHSGAFGRVLPDGGVGHTRLERLTFRTSDLTVGVRERRGAAGWRCQPSLFARVAPAPHLHVCSGTGAVRMHRPARGYDPRGLCACVGGLDFACAKFSSKF